MNWTGVIHWPELCGQSTVNNTDQDIFWDYDKLLKTHSPDFTQCFQQSVITWVWCGFLWFCLPFYSIYLYSRREFWQSCNKTKLNKFKLFLAVLLLAASLADFVQTFLDRTSSYQPPFVLYLDSGIRSATFLATILYIHLVYCVGLHTSGLFFVFWTLQVILGIVQFRSRITKYEKAQGSYNDEFRFATFYIYYGLALISFLLEFVSDIRPDQATTDGHDGSLDERTPLLGGSKVKQKQKLQEENLPECPEYKATFLSNVTHWWITPMLWRGYKRPLLFDDMPNILHTDKADAIVDQFYEVWNEEALTKEKPSLVKALIYTCPLQITLAAVVRLAAAFWEFSNPLLLQAVLDWIMSDDPYTWKGYALAVALLLANFLNAVFYHQFFKYSYQTAYRLRTTIQAAVYRKALKLSSATRRNTTVGEIVNLMSVDAQKIHEVAFDVHEIWAGPLMVVLAMYLLWQVMGPSSLAGLGFLLIVAPINGGVLASRFAALQEVQMTHKDNRIKKTNELLNGIKVLKMYAWERTFADTINEVRKLELNCVRTQAFLNAGIGIVWFAAPFMVPLCIFVAFVLSNPDVPLDPQKAFVTISLTGILNWATAFLPIFIPFAAQAYVSAKRIAGMLLQNEIDPDAVERESSSPFAVSVSHGTFSWNNDSDDTGNGPVLKGIDLEVEDGSLVAVVGTVGAGKSSLVSAMLGEMVMLHGRVTVNGSVAYVPQQAWIQNATLKNNILFGKDYHSDRYQRVIKACALEADLKILPGGDQTEIGEKGINLSGGQKQRVSLCRAVYQNNDIYLLDDPLSAVDAHVGKHIFEHVVGPNGLLSKKTRVLVTHGVTYLPQCDIIVVIRDGEISEVGRYQQLLENNGAFADFLRQYLTELEEEEDEDNPEVIKEKEELSRQLSSITEGGLTTGTESESEGKKLRRRTSVRRAISKVVMKEEEEEKEKEKDTLIEEEEAEVGTIKGAVVKDYIMAATISVCVIALCCHMLLIAAEVGTNIWLSAWTDDASKNITQTDTSVRLGVYGALGGLQVLGIFGTSLSIYLAGVRASNKLHGRLLDRIIQAPMAFFDTTPLGRIINRFSTDMDSVDSRIPEYILWFVFNWATVVSTIIIITYSTPLFLAVAAIFVVIYALTQRVYITAVRQMKRIDSIRKSPIYVNFDETLVGVACVRAFNMEEEFILKNDHLLNNSMRAWYPIVIAQRWLGFFLDTMGAFIVFFATLFAVLTRDTITGGLVGLSVTYAMQTTWAVNMMVRGATELETHIVSAERIKEYSEVETEAPCEIPENEPRKEWPDKGVVRFEDYSTRYRPGLDLVLKGIDFTVNAGEKMGIVGRTGAGKSSVTLGLFRIIEPAEGKILIDDIDITKIGLHDLRSRLTVIPQDPVLFAESLRNNLDPFKAYTDEEIWTALELAHLKPFVTSLNSGLAYEVGEGGEALSVGQRQLVCLARALLRHSQILVLDEATAAVDLETDDLIQETIRSAFSNCTVLTIAHRLNTIMDYDRVMVLDQGGIKEVGKPQDLLKEDSSTFHSMAKDAGLI